MQMFYENIKDLFLAFLILFNYSNTTLFSKIINKLKFIKIFPKIIQ